MYMVCVNRKRMKKVISVMSTCTCEPVRQKFSHGTPPSHERVYGDWDNLSLGNISGKT